MKYAHASGFSVDKLELNSSGSVATETSLTGLAPGLKVEFKGDDDRKGELGIVYKHKLATVTSELDVVDFSTVKAAVVGGHSGVVVGASADIALHDKFDVRNISAVASYSPCSAVFAGVRADKHFSEFTATVQYQGISKLNLAAQVTAVPKSGAHKVQVVGAYAHSATHTFKVKGDSDGIVGLSVKGKCSEGPLVVVGSAEVPVHNVGGFKWGANITLG